jgi:hypothetical protein
VEEEVATVEATATEKVDVCFAYSKLSFTFSFDAMPLRKSVMASTSARNNGAVEASRIDSP